MKRWLWLGVVAILLFGNLVQSLLYVRERDHRNELLVERVQQVRASLRLASMHIQKVTVPDAPEAQFWIQLTIRNLSDAENGFDQLSRHVVTLDPTYLRTMPRHTQRIREQLENIAWHRDYSLLPDVKGAIEDLATLLDEKLKSSGPQDHTAQLTQFRNAVQGYVSPYPGLR